MVALTPFEALVGFRRAPELAELLKRTPEFAACVSADAQLALHRCSIAPAAESEVVRGVFASWATCDAVPPPSGESFARVGPGFAVLQEDDVPSPARDPRGVSVGPALGISARRPATGP